jgi:dihydrofolate synthase / folylpolyglutamate synthase
LTAQHVRGGLARVDLQGRFQIVPGQPAIVLDVAHNPHAVAALVHNLDQMAYHPRTHAVFGAMRDKDLETMLCRVAPLVDAWHFCDLPTPRAASAAALRDLLAGLVAQGRCRGPGTVTTACHADPGAALSAALAGADPADRILVFGSFFTVGGVLAQGLPRTAARHAV